MFNIILHGILASNLHDEIIYIEDGKIIIDDLEVFNKDILPKYFGHDKHDAFIANMRHHSFYVFYFNNNNKTHESDNVNDEDDILTLTCDAKSTRKNK